MDLLDQLVEDIVSEVVNGRRISRDLSVNGQTATSLADFKTKLAAKLREANGEGGEGSGENFANADLVFTGDREHDAAGYDLEIQNLDTLTLFNIKGIYFATDFDEDTNTYLQQDYGIITAVIRKTDNSKSAECTVDETEGYGLGVFLHAAGSGQGYREIRVAETKIYLHYQLGSNDSAITIDTNGITIAAYQGKLIFPGLVNAADDAAAATAGVPVNGIYRTVGAIKIRLS